MSRLNTKLEAEGAEFLVLGQLLLHRILSYKAYTNMPGYDLVAMNPATNTSAKIQVKSRWRTGASGFPIKNFDCDFVVAVFLNRGSKEGTANILPPEYFVFPVGLVKSAPKGQWNKVNIKSIPDYEAYKERWDLIVKFLQEKMSDFHTAMRGQTLQSLINQRAIESPQQIFFISPDSGRRINYQQLRDSLTGCGHAFAEVPCGDTVGGMLGNGWAAVQLLLAAPYHGRRVMLINLAAGDAGLAHSLKHSGCRLIFVDEDNSENLRRVVANNNLNVRIVSINRDDGIPLTDQPTEPPAINHDQDALLIYTSGTTGVPKGVVHTHGSLLAAGANTALAHQLRVEDRALCVLPLCHINAQCVTVMGVLVSGGGVVVPHRFSVSAFWRCLAQTECTWFSVVPTIVSHLLHGEDPPLPLPNLRFGRSASSALAPETHKQFEKRFGVKLYETMGLSETGAQILSNPMPPWPTKYGSPGIAFGNEVIIVDQQGKEMARGQEGEIAVRGDNVMRGYLDAPQETAEVFTDDGWFLTGDLGHMDSDGFVFVTGRRKELIIKGGENIAPREIDDALYLAAGVVEAAAFALACPTYGQRVEAAVVLSSPAAHAEQELIEICAREVGKFKAPERVHFMESLPKGPSGKVQRLKLSKMFGG